MNAESTRTFKEARALFYPWCGVILIGTLPLLGRLLRSGNGYVLVQNQFTIFLFHAATLIGVPFLACLSFGNEFRNKTMDLLLSQPVNRLRIWREKWSVTAIAVVTVTFISVLAGRFPWGFTRESGLDYGIFLVVTTCSAPFWTLLGRSTLRGLVLNIAAFIPLISMKTSLWNVNSNAGYVRYTTAILILLAATLAYSAFMLWLGRWMLVHRQSGEGIAGPDVMGSLPSVLPARVATALQCRPDQLFFNLIRRDLRLLRPLWLLAMLYVMGWSAMAISFSFVPAVGDWQFSVRVILVVVTGTYPIIAMFLAASLPLGEERAFGVQLWHQALPLSMGSQWLTRLLVGSIAGVLCASTIPAALMTLAGAALRPEFMTPFEAMVLREHLPALLAFFVFVFWCAAIARDLTRTAGVAAAAGGLAFIAVDATIWLTEQSIVLAGHLRVFAISWFQLNPHTWSWLPNVSGIPESRLIFVLCLVMVVHTYPLSRRLPQESALKLVRPLVPYLIAISIFVSLMTVRSWESGWGSASNRFIEETGMAIVELPPDRSYTVEELASVSPLSASTQRWLRNTTVTLAVTDFHPSDQQKLYEFFRDWKYVGRLTIHFQSGMICKSTFLFSPDKAQKLQRGSSGTCE